jgi:UDP-2,3-diacylglucosamine pyrophosphatase LpxH
LRKNKETIALFITDLHIGSRWGLWHPDREVRGNGHVTHVPAINNVQAALWDYWVDFCNKLDKIKPDVIFLLGDIINGGTGHRNESAIEDLNEQYYCALMLLRMIPRKVHTSVLSLMGSTSYSQLYLELSQKICLSLGGHFFGTTGIFEFAGHRFRIYHGSTTAYIYLELVMGRRRTFAQEAIARKKLPEIEGIICGHSHRWLHMRTMWHDGRDFHVVLCPGWEGQTDFQIMKDPDKMIPEIGAVIGRFAQDSVVFDCIRYPTPLGISQPVRA